MNRSLLIVVGIVLWLVGCKPGTPSEYIQPDEMEDILVDYHMAKAMAEHADEEYGNRSYQQALFIEAVMQKHGVTKAEFDSSLVYYYRRADRFTEIYEHITVIRIPNRNTATAVIVSSFHVMILMILGS